MTPGGGLVHLSSFQISYLLGWENKSKGGREGPMGRGVAASEDNCQPMHQILPLHQIIPQENAITFLKK